MHSLHASMTNMHLLAGRPNHNRDNARRRIEDRGTPARCSEEPVVKDLFNLPLPERLKRIRELAIEAEAFAAVMMAPELRDSYLRISRHWRDMASQLENSVPAEPTKAPEERSPVQPGEDTK
jgi:hypothetical protein